MKYIVVGILVFACMSCAKEDLHLSPQGNSLRICLQKEPVSLDPRIGNDAVASQVQFMLYEGLLILNPDMTLALGQAESYEMSSDGKTYTFHLRDAVWSDGSPVTAFDFEKSWKSILDPAFASPDAYLLYPIKNGKEAKSGKVTLDEVGIQAQDAKTLVVELKAPVPYFLQIVASSVLLPVKMHEGSTRPEDLMSNGPFQLKKWELNQQMVLEKNPRYHRSKKVKLDQIIIEILDREIAALHMYTSGHFDLVGSPLSFFPSALREDLEKRKLLTSFPVAESKFLAFNTSQFPFQNAHIRRAFAYAISRKALVAYITQLNERVALNVIPPVLFAEDTTYFSDGDEESAKKCLQKGLKELHVDHVGSPIFMYVGSEINHLLAQELQQMWARTLGVNVTLQHVEFKTLHERAEAADFAIGIFAWVAEYSDPMSILERFTDPTSHRNYPKWENQAYNQCLEQAFKAPSRRKYMEKIKEAEKLFVKEMPLTCLFHENYNFLIQPHVKGFAVSPLGHIYFDRISIDHSQSDKRSKLGKTK